MACRDLDCPEPVEGGVDEDDLDRDVGIDMRLGRNASTLRIVSVN